MERVIGFESTTLFLAISGAAAYVRITDRARTFDFGSAPVAGLNPRAEYEILPVEPKGLRHRVPK